MITLAFFVGTIAGAYLGGFFWTAGIRRPIERYELPTRKDSIGIRLLSPLGRVLIRRRW